MPTSVINVQGWGEGCMESGGGGFTMLYLILLVQMHTRGMGGGGYGKLGGGQEGG